MDCAGAHPAHTTIHEIVGAVNAAFGTPVALIEGSRIRLRSRGPGECGEVEFLEPAAAPDAAAEIFGIDPPRLYRGTDAQPPRLVGTVDLAGGLAPGVRRRLRITIDAGPAVDVDLAAGAADPASPTLDEIVAAIVAAAGPGTAARDGGHLVVGSARAGPGGRVTLERYSSLDARPKVLGDIPALACGDDGEVATVTGTVDLVGPVDLSAT